MLHLSIPSDSKNQEARTDFKWQLRRKDFFSDKVGKAREISSKFYKSKNKVVIYLYKGMKREDNRR